ncbi:MAG: hypothetical protein IJK28_05330, partial [Clostridia bacterium]|nr:hypothetical protein [Clostridia bacterium]
SGRAESKAWHSNKNLTIPQELFNGTAPKESRGRSESPLVRPQAHSLTNGISLTKREELFSYGFFPAGRV